MTTSDSTKKWLGICYVLTIFVSAFLLFQVQPLISKYILPWFGGTPAVWTTCMLFFQMVLFAGYTYAHIISSRLSPAAQGVTQIVLMIAALAMLPIAPNPSWKPAGDDQPTLQIIKLLGASVGLPFFILSSTGPLLQSWFSRTHVGRSPYRLYSLSNLGSLLALLSYPFAFEPAFALAIQAQLWSWGFAVYAVGCGLCALAIRKVPASVGEPEASAALAAIDGVAVSPSDAIEAPVRPTIGLCLLWFALPMAASVMLLATTNQVCMDVASIPFLWVVPLSLYLLSFILCFDSDRWYSRWAFAVAMAGSMATVCRVLSQGADARLTGQVFVYFSLLFFSAMFCHGELVQLKPHPRYLTMFYLFISAGGAAGGLFVGLAAPYLFHDFLELPIGMALCLFLLCAVFWRDGIRHIARDEQSLTHGWLPIFASTAAVLGVGALGYHYASEVLKGKDDMISVTRNFYGVLRLKDNEKGEEEVDVWRKYSLTHGRILHGVQFLDEEKAKFPTTYYVEDSGVGLVLTMRNCERDSDNLTPRTKPIRVGVVGLGAGTVAAYAKPGDTFSFYDINPTVVELAQSKFTYLQGLKDRNANLEIKQGDARLSMEREEPQNYDVIVLDAFSSDAIPVHLLTVEAFEIYRRHLVPDGVLAVHISNRHFDLRPVVEGLAEKLGFTAVDILYSVPKFNKFGEPFIDEYDESDSEWVLVSPQESGLENKVIQDSAEGPQPIRIVWTDDKNNLMQVLYDSEPAIKGLHWVQNKIQKLFGQAQNEPVDEDDTETEESES